MGAVLGKYGASVELSKHCFGGAKKIFYLGCGKQVLSKSVGQVVGKYCASLGQVVGKY